MIGTFTEPSKVNRRKRKLFEANGEQNRWSSYVFSFSLSSEHEVKGENDRTICFLCGESVPSVRFTTHMRNTHTQISTVVCPHPGRFPCWFLRRVLPMHYGPEQPRIETCWVTRLFASWHHSLIRLLRTAYFTRALWCSHSFTHSWALGEVYD